MLKRLDQYLLRYFLLSFTAVLIAIGLTIVVINMIDELPDFIDNKVSLLEILEYRCLCFWRCCFRSRFWRAVRKSSP
jgi:lipopolysaccharide export LptBFGC system permease protein LptF